MAAGGEDNRLLDRSNSLQVWLVSLNSILFGELRLQISLLASPLCSSTPITSRANCNQPSHTHPNALIDDGDFTNFTQLELPPTADSLRTLQVSGGLSGLWPTVNPPTSSNPPPGEKDGDSVTTQNNSMAVSLMKAIARRLNSSGPSTSELPSDAPEVDSTFIRLVNGECWLLGSLKPRYIAGSIEKLC